MQRSQKITFGEMRESGVRSVIIACADYRCSRSTTTLADGWPDDVRLSDIEDRFVCKACGRHGANVRPLFGQAPMGTDRAH
jgi:hypothetical protein